MLYQTMRDFIENLSENFKEAGEMLCLIFYGVIFGNEKNS